MTTRARQARVDRVGELRPSALIHTFGVGAVVELPRISVMVMGLDEWRLDQAAAVDEPRLVRSLQKEPGLDRLERLVGPPIAEKSGPRSMTALDAAQRVGVPVAVFPRFLVCPVCRRLGPVESGQFELRVNPFRPERTQYVHLNCQRAKTPPTALPARFVVACEDGHMDDFPWVAFVHRVQSVDEVSCAFSLRLDEVGATGEVAEVFARCETCSAVRPMIEAFGEGARADMPRCSAAHPHLRERTTCTLRMRAMLLGASNSWFAVTRSALSIPRHEDPVAEAVAERWDTLRHVESPEGVALLRSVGQLAGLDAIPAMALWEAILAERAGGDVGEPENLRVREWEIFTKDDRPQSPHFLAREVEVPAGYEALVRRVVLLERLRAVQALMGFTRVDAPVDETGEERFSPLGRAKPTWLPAAEVHGEGVFLQLHEERVQEWAEACHDREESLLRAHRAWCARRNIDNADARFPGVRAALVHSLSHALMRRLALESGYSQAAINERLYVQPAHQEGGAMAGLLLYTAAPGSEGTLGGLVALGQPERLGSLLSGALADAALCDSDPLCAESLSRDEGLTVNGAACYACLFAPETSCEMGNRYLDRAVLVPLVTGLSCGFFDGGGG